MTNKLKALTKDPIQPKLEAQIVELRSELERKELVLSQVSNLMSCSQIEEVVQTLHDIILKNEEMKLLDNEYQALQQSYTSLSAQLKQVEAERDKASLQLKEKDRQLNAKPSNFTKNLLIQKDEEILELKSNLDQLRLDFQQKEEHVWRLEKEVNDANDNFEREVQRHRLEVKAKEDGLQSLMAKQAEQVKMESDRLKARVEELARSCEAKDDEIRQLRYREE